jgi:ATP-dependent helicase HrpB
MLSPLGKKLATMPVHPRLGRLLLAAEACGQRSLGAELAAILSARLPHGVKPDGPDDLSAWLSEWHRAQQGGSRILSRATSQEILRTAQQLSPQYRSNFREPDPALIRHLVLHAYPDRIGKRRDGGSNRVSLPGSVEATIDEHSHLFLDTQESARRRSRSGDLIVAAAVQGISGRSGNRTRLSLGLELDEAEVLARSPEMLEESEVLRYDPVAGRVQSERTRRLGDLVLSCKVFPPDPAKAGAILAVALAEDALGFLRSQSSLANWLDRHAFLCRSGLELPPFDAKRATDFLTILCEGRMKRSEVQTLDFLGWLSCVCSQTELQQVERLAPLSFLLPKGRERSLDYSTETPSISSKLQDFFGLDQHPAILDGKVPLLVHLLSPAQRPVQSTRDLPGFWRGNYKQLRKDLRGRYPKHAWPEEPHAGEDPG